jgi:uncharacterized damage-inducible protein DinB
MMSNANLYRMTDRELLKSMAAFEAGFQPPEVVLQGLTEEQATAKPHGLPHSIADIVGHMTFWQEFFNEAAERGFPGHPERAEVGWPVMKAGEWDSLLRRFRDSVERAQQLAVTYPHLDEKLLPAGFPLPFLQRDTRGSGMLHAVIHTAHHLGQIVTLRQLMGVWPPPGGSMTW